MSLVNELALAKIESNPNRRKLDVWMDTLGPEDKAAFHGALINPEYAHEALFRVIKTLGGNISAASVRRYRTDVLGVKL